MTDNEIIKALEGFEGVKDTDITVTHFKTTTLKEIYLFINRQKAEIERLHKEVGYWEAETKEARADIDQAAAEAIKEFAERLKDYVGDNMYFEIETPVFIAFIDTLVKETAGEE